MSDQESEEVFEIDENQDQSTPDTSTPDTLRILEALLFASDELLNVTKLKTILPGNPDARQIRKMVDKINVQLQKERHPFEVVEIGGGYQFRTVAFYHTWVRQIFKEKASKKLSLQALECLAIIAYKQPLSKAEIEAIRGVVSDGAMKTLLEKNLVVISGRSEKPGRPLLYATSNEFLKYFGLNKIADLPRIEEFEAIAREKMEELSIEELAQGESGELDEDQLEKEQNEKTEAAIQAAKESVAEPESTAVFEISISDADKEKTDASSIDNEDTGTTDESGSVPEPEDTVFESSIVANEKDEKTAEPQTQPDSDDETFDLDVSFESEDVEPADIAEITEKVQQKTDSDDTGSDSGNEAELFEVASGKEPDEVKKESDTNDTDGDTFEFLPDDNKK